MICDLRRLEEKLDLTQSRRLACWISRMSHMRPGYIWMSLIFVDNCFGLSCGGRLWLILNVRFSFHTISTSIPSLLSCSSHRIKLMRVTKALFSESTNAITKSLVEAFGPPRKRRVTRINRQGLPYNNQIDIVSERLCGMKPNHKTLG